MSNETWSPIPGVPGYEASDLGRIRSDRGVMRLSENENGYLTVKCRVNGRYVHLKVHRAVLMAHVGLPDQGQDAAHGDGNKKNNTLSNLRWAARSENERDKLKHGRSNRGSRNGQSVLTEKDVAEIRTASPTCFAQYRTIAAEKGVAPLTIYKIIKGQRWGHVL